MNISKLLIWGSAIAVGGFSLFSLLGHGDDVDYSTQVKPILNRSCIKCHGGVKKQGGFSVLFREEALGKTKSGKPAIIPGDPEHSDFIARLTHKDLEERMPYQAEPLSKEEIELLTKWVKQGAKWGEHWAFTTPELPSVPGKNFFAGFSDWFSAAKWEKNDIDYFVSEKLKQEQLSHSEQAEKGTLFRRVCLDLTGLPPTETQLSDFLNDKSDNAYEKAVDKLLASPQYGERWAGMWLDLARYSDTKGYERDYERSIWKYRDYVIDAFNQNMPYNQFIKEQLAGDLLPNPTDNQLIATGFHRNTMTNDEGGTDNEEFRTSAVLDRTNTTWEVLQGTTFSCIQCHSHPYDPFRHEDYYKYVAFFNNTRDEDSYGDYPNLRLFKKEDAVQVANLKNWILKNSSLEKAQEYTKFLKTWQPTYNSLSCDKFVKAELADTKFLGIQNGGSARLKNVDLRGKNQMIIRYNSYKLGGSITIRLDKPDGEILLSTKLDTTNGFASEKFNIKPVNSGFHDLYIAAFNPAIKGTEEYVTNFDWFGFLSDFPAKNNLEHDSMQKEFWRLANISTDITLVMDENPQNLHRKSYVFERGGWTNKGKEVQPDIPTLFGGLPKNLPRNRLGLATWIGSEQNPLTARVAVNRFWEQIFGVGLVETMEDFGTQGFTPSNPKLLDFLSIKFMKEYNWQPKQLLKEIVLSATYQQDSKVTPEMLEKDPANRYFARGARVRLSAEQVRDQALLVSGILSYKMFGKSVMPYQPEGIWNIPYSDLRWKQSEGEDQFRRALYTYWRRSSPYPSMMTFDGTSREVCLARRLRTNTPLQALTSLNDPVYVECARYFAKRMDNEKSDISGQIKKGYLLAMSKEISGDKLLILNQLYQKSYQDFKKKPNEAMKFLGFCSDNTLPKNMPDLAAKTMVAMAILNLDEVIMKE
jgi:mono/diheme cytochrome c family protein